MKRQRPVRVEWERVYPAGLPTTYTLEKKSPASGKCYRLKGPGIPDLGWFFTESDAAKAVEQIRLQIEDARRRADKDNTDDDDDSDELISSGP